MAGPEGGCLEDHRHLRRLSRRHRGRGTAAAPLRRLVVDGGASTRRALLGDILAGLAAANGWAGIIINGCIRDSVDIADIEVGVMALGTVPLKSRKHGDGEADVSVHFAGLTFRPGRYVYADEDGVVLANHELGPGG